jgi:hypothetical protein
LDEPVPSDLDPVGEEATELPGDVALRLCFDHISILRPTGIGSNTTPLTDTNGSPAWFVSSA